MFNYNLTQLFDFIYRQRWFQIVLVSIVALPSLAAAVVPAADTAAKVVEVLHAELLFVMKQAKKLGYAGRYQRLAPTVTASYDFPYISKVVVGRYWRGFTTEQKSLFITAFSKLSIATYANRFDGYTGERFKTISGEELKRGHRLVKTVLIKANGEEIELDYVLHQNNDQWRIINVIAEGVSDLSLKRADYTSYLKKNGFDALLQKITDKIKSYEG
ncbi:MAG: ABC transporter substrate-binding protein [Deltaproteobacteria bacterium]|nr:MAG: ABC transporter substrate-binding protein [Deltaproteobacteria bacterium]